MSQNTKYISARITTRSGMGGAFSPPNHPMHTHSIETDLNIKKENRGAMSLEYALTQEYVSPALKNEINNLLSSYQLPDINNPIIIKWINECLNYFGKEKGIEFIRKYYPEYKS